jgi:hypothetical protein
MGPETGCGERREDKGLFCFRIRRRVVQQMSLKTSGMRAASIFIVEDW